MPGLESVEGYRKISLKNYRKEFNQKRENETVIKNPKDRLFFGVGPQKEEWKHDIDERTKLEWKGVEVAGVKLPTDKVELKFEEEHFSDETATINKISTEHTLFLRRLGIDDPDYRLFLGKMKLPMSVTTGLELGYETATKIETNDNLHIIIKPGIKAYAKADASVLAGKIEGKSGKDMEKAKAYFQATNDDLDKGVVGGARVQVGVRLSFGIEIFKLVDNKMRAQGVFSITLGFSFLNIGSNVDPGLLTFSEKDIDGEKMAYISQFLSVKKYIGFEALSPYAIIEGGFNKALFVDKNDDGIKRFLMELLFSNEMNFIAKAAWDLLPSQEYLGLRVASLRGVPMAPEFSDLYDKLYSIREYLWSDSLDKGNSSYIRGLEELVQTLNTQYELLYNDFINEKYPYEPLKSVPENATQDIRESVQWIVESRRRLGTFCKRSIESINKMTQRQEQHLVAIKRELGRDETVDLTKVPKFVREELFTWMTNNTIQLGETNGIVNKNTLIVQLENAISRQKKFQIKLNSIFGNMLYGKLDKGGVDTKIQNFFGEVYYSLDAVTTDFGNFVNYERFNRAQNFIQSMREQRHYIEGEMGKLKNSEAANQESNPDARFIFKMLQAYINEYIKLDIRTLEKDLDDQDKYNHCEELINIERDTFRQLVEVRSIPVLNQILNDPHVTDQTKNYFHRLRNVLNSDLLGSPNPRLPNLD